MADLTTVSPDTFVTRFELAAGLTILRLQAGLTIRELAGQLGLPMGTVGDYMAGRRLPGPGQHENFARLLRACGVENEGARNAWFSALARVRMDTDGRLCRPRVVSGSAQRGMPVTRRRGYS